MYSSEEDSSEYALCVKKNIERRNRVLSEGFKMLKENFVKKYGTNLYSLKTSLEQKPKRKRVRKSYVSWDENGHIQQRHNPLRAARCSKNMSDCYVSEDSGSTLDDKMPKGRYRHSRRVQSFEMKPGSIDTVALRFKDKVYDSINGTSCHQCRQKTADTKTNCSSCNSGRGQFCGACLKIRYGENITDVLKNKNWNCPSCRGICNCSICRKQDGGESTGILIPVAKHNGFDNVKDYLKKIAEEVEESMRKEGGQNAAA